MIDREIKQELVKVICSKARELELQVIEANGVDDHFHVLIESNPSVSPSDIAKGLKGSSSHYINHVTLKGDKLRSLYWQDGYGVISVSPSAVKSISDYIRNQETYHGHDRLTEDYET
jgi:putative transposase